MQDIGYAQTFEEAYERIENLYKEEEDGVPHENPPVEDFLVWRDMRVFDGKVYFRFVSGSAYIPSCLRS